MGKSYDQKSKVYGDKVMKKIGEDAVQWAIQQTSKSKDKYKRGYTGYVRSGPYYGERRVENFSIYKINDELTTSEQKEVLEDVLYMLRYNNDMGSEVEDVLRSYTSKRQKRHKMTDEEACVLDSLEEKGKSIRQLKKQKIYFNSSDIPDSVRYILAKHALLYEIGLRNERLKDDNYMSTERRHRLGESRSL